MSFAGALRRIGSASGVELSEQMVEACAAHYQLLVTWNRTHNLTRVVDQERAVRLHYLDCLVPLLSCDAPRSFVDVGSGAGFPGLMAMLVWPSAVAVLLEPARKRASFLTMAASRMGLNAAVEGLVRQGEEPQGERVLSRATFPPGARRQLIGYAGPAGEIVVWGHPHDVSTWEAEVATWGWHARSPLGYRVEGVEPRCLLRASRTHGQ